MHRRSDIHTLTHTHIYIYVHTCIQRHWHIDTDTQRHMHVCIQTHTLVCMWEIVTSNPLLSQNCYFKHENWGNCYFKYIFKLQLATIVTLNGKSQEMITWNVL